MKVGFVTTLRTNIGDDMIRVGIVRLLRELAGGRELDLLSVNKHEPATAWPAAHPIRLAPAARRIPRVGGRVAAAILARAPRVGRSRFADRDVIVQCGAPVLFPNCHAAEFSVPGWEGALAPLAARIPVLNLAAGSCYPFEAPPETVPDPRDAAFLARILDLCRLTTVRDAHAERLCASLGRPVPRLPCTAFFAGWEAPPRADAPEVLVSYMAGAGHFDWEQGIDAAAWEETAREAIRRIGRRRRVAFLCHDDREAELAARLDPARPRIVPRTLAEYVAATAGAKAALVNRLHAGVVLAGAGIPSVAVGTDTRLLMVRELGLPARYVKEATAEGLAADVEALLDRREEERERLLALRRDAFARYLALLREALP